MQLIYVFQKVTVTRYDLVYIMKWQKIFFFILKLLNAEKKTLLWDMGNQYKTNSRTIEVFFSRFACQSAITLKNTRRQFISKIN